MGYFQRCVRDLVKQKQYQLGEALQAPNEKATTFLRVTISHEAKRRATGGEDHLKPCQ